MLPTPTVQESFGATERAAVRIMYSKSQEVGLLFMVLLFHCNQTLLSPVADGNENMFSSDQTNLLLQLMFNWLRINKITVMFKKPNIHCLQRKYLEGQFQLF